MKSAASKCSCCAHHRAESNEEVRTAAPHVDQLCRRRSRCDGLTRSHCVPKERFHELYQHRARDLPAAPLGTRGSRAPIPACSRRPRSPRRTSSFSTSRMRSRPMRRSRPARTSFRALNEIDWGTKTMMVRINGLDTHYMYRDVVDIVEACPRLDMILIPKTGVAAGRLCRRHDGDAR